jgi:4-hydroxybenzoate polyprenyltransferase
MTIFGLLTYTWFKRRWWGGPWYNAWIVSLVALLGYLGAVGASGESLAFGIGLGGTMLVAFAAYANFVLTGYYKDIDADRATGYVTLPVAFGRRMSAFVSDGIAIAALVIAVVTLLHHGWHSRLWLAAPFLVGATACSAIAQLRLHRVRSDKTAHRAIEPVVHSYILLLAALAAAHQPQWAPFLVAFYAAFIWTMKRRPMRAQI